MDVKAYTKFRGVDYSASPASISDDRAADMLNMYVGDDGIMQKRPGWHVIKRLWQREGTTYTGAPVHGMHTIALDNGQNALLVHAGTYMWWTTVQKPLRNFWDTDAGDVPAAQASAMTEDAVNMVLHYIDGTGDELEEWQVQNMDANNDGKVTVEDVRLIAGYFSGQIPMPLHEVNPTTGSFNFMTGVTLAQQKSVSFVHEGSIYLLDGVRYYKLSPILAQERAQGVTANVTITKLTGFEVTNVTGYIPTTEINGHYEYLEPESEAVTGDTIVESQVVTVAQGSNKASFIALFPFVERIVVSLAINSSSICNTLTVEPENNEVNIGYCKLKYTNGSVEVTSNAVPLQQGDKVKLFIKEEDGEKVIIGEPGTSTNVGTWIDPKENEPRNLLNIQQMVTFAADGIHKNYYLPVSNVLINKVELRLYKRCKLVGDTDVPTQEDISHVDAGTYNGVTYYYKEVWVNVPYNDSDYPWSKIDVTSSDASASNIQRLTARLFFSTNKPQPSKDGEDNIRVTFTPREFATDEAIERDRGYIKNCTIITRFGYFNDNRFVFSGNPKYKNMDWISAVDDPTYFPYNGWTKIGADETAIQGYLHYGTELAIIKEDNNVDATVFMRSAVLTEENDVLFPVQQGTQSVGAISKNSLGVLRDDPLFLAREGVFAIEGTDASQQRNIPNRSHYIDKKLISDVSKSCASVVWGNYFLLANPLNGRCYVADARSRHNYNGSILYDWYVWDNIPATTFLVIGSYCFFGTQDGRVCEFNEWDTPDRYADNMRYVNGEYTGGVPINAYYVTKRDNLGVDDFKKTMLHDGGIIKLEPQENSSVAITVTTERGEYFVDDIQTESEEPVIVVPIRKRMKNFDSIQTRVENAEINEGLALLGIQYRYAITTNRRQHNGN